MRLILLGVLVLASFSWAYDVQLSFDLQQSGTLAPLSQGVLTLSLTDPIGNRVKTIQLLNGPHIRVTLPAGTWELLATLDDPSTESADFAAYYFFNISQNTTQPLVLEPVAGVSGLVMDSANATLPNARVGLRCPSSAYDFAAANGRTESDEFGAFSLSYVPVSSCRLLASKDNRLGYSDLTLQRGGLHRLRLSLSQQTVTLTPTPVPDKPAGVPSWLVFLVAALVAAIVIALVVLRRPGKDAARAAHAQRANESPKGSKTARKTPPSNSQNAPTGISRTRKMNAILNTLSANEKRTVEFLLENNGRARFSKLFYALLIPKTTLSRVLFALENKNIIKTTSFGKVRDLELTEWFLSEK